MLLRLLLIVVQVVQMVHVVVVGIVAVVVGVIKLCQHRLAVAEWTLHVLTLLADVMLRE